MKDIITKDYEVKNRRRIKLADGKRPAGSRQSRQNKKHIKRRKVKMKKKWIQLVKYVGDFQEMEVWQAICHHDGHHTEGWALVTDDTADFFDTDPRNLPEEYLIDGYRLPAYMPGYRPEQE